MKLLSTFLLLAGFGFVRSKQIPCHHNELYFAARLEEVATHGAFCREVLSRSRPFGLEIFVPACECLLSVSTSLRTFAPTISDSSRRIPTKTSSQISRVDTTTAHSPTSTPSTSSSVIRHHSRITSEKHTTSLTWKTMTAVITTPHDSTKTTSSLPTCTSNSDTVFTVHANDTTFPNYAHKCNWGYLGTHYITDTTLSTGNFVAKDIQACADKCSDLTLASFPLPVVGASFYFDAIPDPALADNGSNCVCLGYYTELSNAFGPLQGVETVFVQSRITGSYGYCVDGLSSMPPSKVEDQNGCPAADRSVISAEYGSITLYCAASLPYDSLYYSAPLVSSEANHGGARNVSDCLVSCNQFQADNELISAFAASFWPDSCYFAREFGYGFGAGYNCLCSTNYAGSDELVQIEGVDTGALS